MAGYSSGSCLPCEAAKDLQEGKETGGIGFYAPDIIKGNMIDSITGFGYLHPKAK